MSLRHVGVSCRDPSRPSGIRQWRGDSRGWWEGDTLVVDTVNFGDYTTFYGPPTPSKTPLTGIGPMVDQKRGNIAVLSPLRQVKE